MVLLLYYVVFWVFFFFYLTLYFLVNEDTYQAIKERATYDPFYAFQLDWIKRLAEHIAVWWVGHKIMTLGSISGHNSSLLSFPHALLPSHHKWSSCHLPYLSVTMILIWSQLIVDRNHWNCESKYISSYLNGGCLEFCLSNGKAD